MPTNKLDKNKLREVVQSNLDVIISKVNSALRGESLEIIEPTLRRIGRGGRLPHWFEGLNKSKTLPNLDGKTIGSVVEMILVGVLEADTLVSYGNPILKINPARGVDLPDLDLGVKSPSENYCTSEPFFSAYERLLGNEYDALILLTDYQTAKSDPPLRLQITKWKYLKKTQIADKGLCRIALKHRQYLLDEKEEWAKKVFRFLAYVNQSDWLAKKLLTLVDNLQDDLAIGNVISAARSDFESKNRQKAKKDGLPIPDEDLKTLTKILRIRPRKLGVIDAADNWVVKSQKEAGRIPSDNEWNRFITSPLDGVIGMSFALQWRYNFGRLFGKSAGELQEFDENG